MKDVVGINHYITASYRQLGPDKSQTKAENPSSDPESYRLIVYSIYINIASLKHSTAELNITEKDRVGPLDDCTDDEMGPTCGKRVLRMQEVPQSIPPAKAAAEDLVSLFRGASILVAAGAESVRRAVVVVLEVEGKDQGRPWGW